MSLNHFRQAFLFISCFLIVIGMHVQETESRPSPDKVAAMTEALKILQQLDRQYAQVAKPRWVISGHVAYQNTSKTFQFTDCCCLCVCDTKSWQFGQAFWSSFSFVKKFMYKKFHRRVIGYELYLNYWHQEVQYILKSPLSFISKISHEHFQEKVLRGLWSSELNRFTWVIRETYQDT